MFLSSCINDPEFNDVPKIKFKKVTFKRIGGVSAPDSLTISLEFQDGNGDLGLDNRFTQSPFNSTNFFVDDNGQLITIEHLGRPGFEFLPEFTFPERCESWLTEYTVEGFIQAAGLSFSSQDEKDAFIQSLNLNLENTDEGLKILDTLYFEPNPNHNNLHLDIMLLKDDGEDFSDADGNYEIFNWLTDLPISTCGSPLTLRFPIMSNLNDSSPLEGTLSYSLASPFIEASFGNEKIKLRIKILDRELNQSNTVFSELFTLNEILAN